jgi:hypothetical protein
LRLIKLRERLPDTTICVFEGDDDKLVYSQWIRRIRSDLDYEPFPCGGKEQVLRLRDAVQQDLNGLGRCVFFFVDRDFDDLQGRQAGADLFMTGHYSVENYLVTDTVLADLLKNEFHCHADPDVRQRTVELFKATYAEFLSVTKPVNFRIFAARRLGLKLDDSLPKKLTLLAVVSLNKALPSGVAPEDLIALPRDLSAEEQEMLEADFESLDRQSRYRGKFAILFFHKWLTELCNEYANRTTDLFTGLSQANRVRQNELTLGIFASKATMPSGFDDFVAKICPPVSAATQRSTNTTSADVPS